MVLALCMLVPAGAGSLADDASTTLDDAPSSEDEAGLAAPLVKLATTPSEVRQIRTAYAAGQAWGQAQLAADEARLVDAVDELYAALALEASAAAEPVPAAFRVPLAALVTLQAHHAAASGPFAGFTDDGAQAFTLGVLDPVLAAFEEAREEAPEEPVFVDPLGLIVLGGSGDNVYEPRALGPTEWQGPIVLVEPAGNETYDVPVAAPTTFDRPQAPVDPIEDKFQYGSLALELGGNDTYDKRTASADLGPATNAILVDRHGGDAYATTGIARTTAYGGPGFAYLLDEEGDDAYYAAREGIAHAFRTSSAVLWDQQGNDDYRTQLWNGEKTHAIADSREAAAMLWDEEGSDTHRAGLFAFGSAWNDAVARFVDEGGDDAYEILSPDLSFGFRFEEATRLIGDGTLGRGFGEFVDGSGDDTYTWHTAPDDPPTPSNDVRHVDHRDDRKWGVFIDCETTADADRPCEEDQHQARCTMVRHPAEFRSEVEPFVALVLDPVEDECRSLGA